MYTYIYMENAVIHIYIIILQGDFNIVSSQTNPTLTRFFEMQNSDFFFGGFFRVKRLKRVTNLMFCRKLIKFNSRQKVTKKCIIYIHIYIYKLIIDHHSRLKRNQFYLFMCFLCFSIHFWSKHHQRFPSKRHLEFFLFFGLLALLTPASRKKNWGIWWGSYLGETIQDVFLGNSRPLKNGCSISFLFVISNVPW